MLNPFLRINIISLKAYLAFIFWICWSVKHRCPYSITLSLSVTINDMVVLTNQSGNVRTLKEKKNCYLYEFVTVKENFIKLISLEWKEFEVLDAKMRAGGGSFFVVCVHLPNLSAFGRM